MHAACVHRCVHGMFAARDNGEKTVVRYGMSRAYIDQLVDGTSLQDKKSTNARVRERTPKSRILQ